MCNPGAVVTCMHLAQFVLPHFVERLLVCDRVVLDGNLRGHATHRVDAPTMTRVNQEVHIRLEKGTIHCDRGAVRQDEGWMVTELLDEAENVVPAPAVQTRSVLAQFVEDLVHLERCQNCLDQNGSANRAPLNSQFLLRKAKNVIPQARFEMALQLGQIKIWTRSCCNQFRGVVKEVQAKIKEGGGNGHAID